jgi:hypothetical protein
MHKRLVIIYIFRGSIATKYDSPAYVLAYYIILAKGI